MKQYKILLITMALILIVNFAVCMNALLNTTDRGTDYVLLNDITQTAKEHFSAPEELNSCGFGIDYVILDAQGNQLYATIPSKIKNSGDAVREHYPYMMIMDGDKLLGTAIILESQEKSYQKSRKTAVRTVLISELCLAFCMVLWAIFIRRKIIKPFRKMENFAEEIAAGNLNVPLEMDKGNMFGVFTESFDIMREELASAREREIALKRREKELIASLSHDLKTPITGIKLTAELMQAQAEKQSDIEKLTNISKKAEQIDALVNDLFTSTMKDLGEMKVTLTEENSAVLHEFIRRCDDRELTEETAIPECIIKTDTRRMEQIIWNIISNSYKYAGTKISVSYAITDNSLKMSIRDYGAGVPEDELMLVTNKFYRSRTLTGNPAEGSGLGLYNAKILIEKMNGGIRCQNADPGFEVLLFIPLA